MNEDVVYSASKVFSFSPWEIVLMGVVLLLSGVIVKIVHSFYKHLNEDSKMSTEAINNNTAVLKELKDEMARKLKKATKQ